MTCSHHARAGDSTSAVESAEICPRPDLLSPSSPRLRVCLSPPSPIHPLPRPERARPRSNAPPFRRGSCAVQYSKLHTEAQALKAHKRSLRSRQSNSETHDDLLFDQLHQKEREHSFLQDHIYEAGTAANDNEPDIFEQLREQQTQSNKRKQQSGLDLN